MNKKFWEENKDRYNAQKRGLAHRRKMLEINEELAKPWHDPESLYCSPELENILNGKPLSKDK